MPPAATVAGGLSVVGGVLALFLTFDVSMTTWHATAPGSGPSIFFFNFYQSLVDIQYCVSFRCIVKHISYTYINIHSFFPPLFFRFFFHIDEYRVLRSNLCASFAVNLGDVR